VFDTTDESSDAETDEGKQPVVEQQQGLLSLVLEELETMLSEAVENEDFELASKIRDEINRRK
jgi:protein-arginine kinase activator protein McsA